MPVPFWDCENETVTEFPILLVILLIVGVVPSTVIPFDGSENTSPAGFLATIEMLYAVYSVKFGIVIDVSVEDASSRTLEPSKE